jgi:hypothetical protein
MNIFALSDDPQEAARAHCDKHVNKMLLEGTQILNGSLYERDLDDLAFYGYTHKHHPCTLWAAESWGNFEWLMRLVHHLNDEFMHRFDHEDPHTSYEKISDNWFEDGQCTLPLEDEPLTDFALAMPDDVKGPDSIEAYRTYYTEYKQPEDWFGYEKGVSAPTWL